MTVPRRSFLVLAANTPWVYSLAKSLEPHAAVTALRMYDWANYSRLQPKWPEHQSAVNRRTVTMPPGYAGTLEPLFRPLLRWIIDRERSSLRNASGQEPTVVCPYPYLAPWVRQVPSEQLVYYNLDDYRLYDPRRAGRTDKLERELIQRARATVCLSMHQVDTLRSQNPARANRVHHFPLGVAEYFLNPDPGHDPLPQSIGYVGNMTGRVDWRFVAAVARALPDKTFHFVGNAADETQCGSTRSGWRIDRSAALALPNVVCQGPVPQPEVAQHYWKYQVNWMPYDVDHPFNIASCPTKIMDALASGRPFVSTRIPEVLLYPGLVHVAGSVTEAVSILRDLVDGRAHSAESQVSFARSQTWPRRALRFLDLIDSAGTV